MGIFDGNKGTPAKPPERTASITEENKKLYIEKEKEYRTLIEKAMAIQKSGDLKSMDPRTSAKARDDAKEICLKCYYIAKALANLAPDEESRKKWEQEYKSAAQAAQRYGSIMKNIQPQTTMDDIAGLDEVKKLVESFIFMAQNQEVIKHYHMKGGLGLMMFGAPGTGKTMFAEAIANRMNLPLFVVTPADIFKSYVGESEQAVRQLFAEIDLCPDGAILFVDECESIFSKRSGNEKEYKAAVTTELLQRINGFNVDGSKRVLVGATNRPDYIDPAYLRYKRFSHIVHIEPPDHDALLAIVNNKLKGIDLVGINTEEIAKMADDARYNPDPDKAACYSAADISGVVEEACRQAIEQIQSVGGTKPIPLTREMFLKAFEKCKPSISMKSLNSYRDFLKNRGEIKM